ncbi:hypothetical protein CAI21_15260 [Alkalilimnicola ehrlichii]|uniref:Uncharacterized protein n=1 Tax=Alkalilimnicola ehrlichii TaxID=351052 RepID=A0A3E0WTS4_9GAMM|nr:hypothetical protein [Alkalilimnicola ehrlichii]RFA27204.1 hypothetical protein CAI21_15260 [Alkalilimnicola ehrlichii]RFA35376.1 hypothetical protein CAL65_12920 [Alkalilimnicola ehrlichii]
MITSDSDRTRLEQALALRDLSDPEQGPHAIQDIVYLAHETLAKHWGCRRQLHRESVLTTRPSTNNARTLSLRQRAAASALALLRSLSLDPPEDVLLVLPGLVVRNPKRPSPQAAHQLALVRLVERELGGIELAEMVQKTIKSVLPKQPYRLLPIADDDTLNSMQIDARDGRNWMPIGRCGRIKPASLHNCGINPNTHSALLLELELDDIVALRKSLPDIALLRSENADVAQQMLNLEPYEAIGEEARKTAQVS